MAHAGLEWHREKQLKYAVLRSLAELMYHYSTGGDTKLGSWFSRKRASVSRALARSRSGRSTSSSGLRLDRWSSSAASAEMSVQSSTSTDSPLARSSQTPQAACTSSQGPQAEAQESTGRVTSAAPAAAHGVPLGALDRCSRSGSGRLSLNRSGSEPSSESMATESGAVAPVSTVPTTRSLRGSIGRETQSIRPEAPALSVSDIRRGICASHRERGASARSHSGSEDSTSFESGSQSVQTKSIRRMQLRDQVELTKEMVEGTAIYLSPHYRQLPASGVAEDDDDVTHNMYNELSTQFGALGVKIKSEEIAFSNDERALVLTVLCPGFFGCPELVEETSCALRSDQKQRGFDRTASVQRAMSGLTGTRPRQNSAELSFGMGDFSRRFSFRRKPKSVVLLASTAMPYDEYYRTCPPDLKELGIFDLHMDKWPESPWLQPTAAKTVIYRLPDATRYTRANVLIHRLGMRGSANAAGLTPDRARLPAVAEQRERRASAANLGARQLSSCDHVALSSRLRDRRASRGSSSRLVSMEGERDQAALTHRRLSEEGSSEQRYQRERAAYRALRLQPADGPSSPATLPRPPSPSEQTSKPPAALPPEELAASSATDVPRARSFPAALEPPRPIASEPMLNEHGAEVPMARCDSGRHVLPRAPPDALDGATTSRKARASSSGLPPIPSLAAASAPPDVPHCGSREAESTCEETQPANAPHVMSSPRPECQRRLTGFL